MPKSLLCVCIGLFWCVNRSLLVRETVTFGLWRILFCLCVGLFLYVKWSLYVCGKVLFCVERGLFLCVNRSLLCVWKGLSFGLPTGFFLYVNRSLLCMWIGPIFGLPKGLFCKWLSLFLYVKWSLCVFEDFQRFSNTHEEEDFVWNGVFSNTQIFSKIFKYTNLLLRVERVLFWYVNRSLLCVNRSNFECQEVSFVSDLVCFCRWNGHFVYVEKVSFVCKEASFCTWPGLFCVRTSVLCVWIGVFCV